MRNMSVAVTFVFALSFASACAFNSAILRAVFSSETSSNLSPKFGNSLKPVTTTGVEGVAFPFGLFFQSTIVRTFAYVLPATINSPVFSSPPVINKFTTEPFPTSIWLSITRPSAGILVSAFNSSMSAVNKIISSNFSTFSPVFAEIGTIIVSPPHSSGLRLKSVANCAFVRSILAPSLSILFIATIIFAFAASANLIASAV